jgi:hypothetical protein
MGRYFIFLCEPARILRVGQRMSEEQQGATAFTSRTVRMNSEHAIAVVVKNKTVTVMQSGWSSALGGGQGRDG